MTPKDMTDSQIIETAERNQRRAWDVIRSTGAVSAWTRVGAEVNIVGSLATGLLMTHLDIDMHVYTSTLDVNNGFAAMAGIASSEGIKKVEYTNLADTDEACMEWHAWYEDREGDTWQIDIINILKGSRYDGFFERTASRIKEALTADTRLAILRLKGITPKDVHIPGIEYCQAVMQGGVKTWEDFTAWRKLHHADGIVEWMP